MSLIPRCFSSCLYRLWSFDSIFLRVNTLISAIFVRFARAASWNCGCDGFVYRVPQVIIDHAVATWSSSAASLAGATMDCGKYTLIDTNIVNITCLKEYISKLQSEDRSKISKVWMKNVDTSTCKYFDAKESKVKDVTCDKNLRYRILCEERTTLGKWNLHN